MAEIKVYTLDEIAEIMKVTRRTVYSYVKSGKLHAVKFGKYWKVTEENFREFLNTGYERSGDR